MTIVSTTSVRKMAFLQIGLLLVAMLCILPAESGKSSCSASTSSNRITCRSPSGSSVTCTTVAASWYSSGKTPPGRYLIDYRGWRSDKRTYWYNLHPRRRDGKYHYYYDENPDNGRKLIALHGGSRSLGCITVSDDRCYSRLRRVINAGSRSTYTVQRSRWRLWERTTTITYIGIITVT